MSNLPRLMFEIEIGDKSYDVKPNFKTALALESRFQMNLSQLTISCAVGRAITNITGIIYEALRQNGHRKVDYETVGDAVVEEYEKYSDIAADILRAYLKPQKQAEEVEESAGKNE